MKNIHILPTDKPSRLFIWGDKLRLGELVDSPDYFPKLNQSIYITSDEEIREGDYVYNTKYNNVRKYFLKVGTITSLQQEDKKIILTTDQDLIKDGVQAIDDEFLEWFAKNPSCEEVEVEKECCGQCDERLCEVFDTQIGWTKQNTYYKIIIPKEEHKQLFTDYPIIELGDKEFKEAPIRQCELLSYDDNKYCYVKVEGIETEIKRCYIYPQKGRCGEVDCVSIEEIKELLKYAEDDCPKKRLNEPKTKCYCGHTTYCDCGPLEEPKQEIWKDIPNYEGLYQVSNLGNVKSLERFVKGKIDNRLQKENILSKRLVGEIGNQYYAVTLCNNKDRKQIKISVLVAMAFLNHIPNGYVGFTVDHIDNNPLNNNVNNLQVITKRENSSKDRKGISKYTGVTFNKKTNKWRSQIWINGQNKPLGSFDDELEAHRAYQKELQQYLKLQ